MIRTFAHADVEELARFATVPVINGLTDLLPPLPDPGRPADGHGEPGRRCDGKTVAWIGDGNNMAQQLDRAPPAVLGFELRLACPEGYEPDPRDLRARARKRTRDHADRARPTRRCAGAARGQHRRLGLDGPGGGGRSSRAQAFQGYMVDEGLMARRRPRGDLPPLPPGPPRRGGERGGARGTAVAGVGRGREPAARAEGADGDADGRQR